MESLTYLAQWLSPLVLGSVVGILCYCAMMVARDDVQLGFLTLGIFLLTLPLLFIWCAVPYVGVLSGIICVVAAFCECWRDGEKAEWNWYFLRLFAATSQCLAIGLFLGALGSSDAENSLEDIHVAQPGLLLGLLITPSAISVLRWMFQNIKQGRSAISPLKEADDLK